MSVAINEKSILENVSKRKRRSIVFFDFDNTITSFDVLDDIIERFSINQDWIVFEKAWTEGKIGSKECLQNQLKSVRVSKKVLAAYLSGIKVDPYFVKLISLFKEKRLEYVIVSDSFSWVIKEILRHHGIVNIRVFSNRVKFQGDRLIPFFPYESAECRKCAHCKKRHVLQSKAKRTFYIGDGLSDICPAQEADVVFAKGQLLKHFQEMRQPCLDFKNLGDIYNYFQTAVFGESRAKKALAVA